MRPLARSDAAVWDADRFTSWPELAPAGSGSPKPGNPDGSTAVEQTRGGADLGLAVGDHPAERAGLHAAVVDMGHGRWSIENQGFNELVNRWHADHVYKHHPAALLVFLLLALLCLNVFMAFYHRNLKPAVRRAATMLHIAQLIAAELYAAILTQPARASP